MQVQLHLMVAEGADRTGRHAHFAARNRLAGLDGRFSDIRRADRAEQLAFRAGLGLQLELEILERLRALLRLCVVLSRAGFEYRALRLELRDVPRVGRRRPPA